MNTPSLLHAQEDFPVIQPAVVIRVFVYLAERLRKKKEAIKKNIKRHHSYLIEGCVSY